jgi:hypothetical protein
MQSCHQLSLSISICMLALLHDPLTHWGSYFLPQPIHSPAPRISPPKKQLRPAAESEPGANTLALASGGGFPISLIFLYRTSISAKKCRRLDLPLCLAKEFQDRKNFRTFGIARKRPPSVAQQQALSYTLARQGSRQTQQTQLAKLASDGPPDQRHEAPQATASPDIHILPACQPIKQPVTQANQAHPARESQPSQQ